MEPIVTLVLNGAQSEAAAEVLARRLDELGHPARREGGRVSFSASEPASLAYALGTYDPPEFAAEKILDDLEGRGWVKLEESPLLTQTESVLRDRLKNLGYLE